MTGECQEPGCRHPSTKSWSGRKVCSDHYDYYDNKQQEMLMDMEDYGH